MPRHSKNKRGWFWDIGNTGNDKKNKKQKQNTSCIQIKRVQNGTYIYYCRYFCSFDTEIEYILYPGSRNVTKLRTEFASTDWYYMIYYLTSLGSSTNLGCKFWKPERDKHLLLIFMSFLERHERHESQGWDLLLMFMLTCCLQTAEQYKS